MVENVVMRPRAVQDMQDGFDWYELKRPGPLSQRAGLTL